MDNEKVCTTCGAEFVMFGDYNLCGYCKTNTLIDKGTELKTKKWWEFWK